MITFIGASPCEMQCGVERCGVVGGDDDVHDVVFLQQRRRRRDRCLAEPPEHRDAPCGGCLDIGDRHAGGSRRDPTFDDRELGRRVDPVGCGVRRQQVAQDPSTGPRDGGDRGDAEALVDRGAARVVDAGDDVLDAEGLAGHAGDEDVGVVATGDGGDGTIGGDAGRGQNVAVEPDADHGGAREPLAETAERLEPAVDHDDIMFRGGEAESDLRADSATTDNDDMHAWNSYCSSVWSPVVWIGTETTAVCGR